MQDRGKIRRIRQNNPAKCRMVGKSVACSALPPPPLNSCLTIQARTLQGQVNFKYTTLTRPSASLGVVALSKKWLLGLVRDRVCVLGGPWWSMVHSNGPCFRRTVLVHGPVHGPCFRGTPHLGVFSCRDFTRYDGGVLTRELLHTFKIKRLKRNRDWIITIQTAHGCIIMTH